MRPRWTSSASGPTKRTIGVQIFGAEPEAMHDAARLVTDVFQPDFIDINFGCPVKKVVKRNGGSGCLKDLDLVQNVIRAGLVRHPPAGDRKDQERLERGEARSGGNRAALPGCRRARTHAAPAHADADVQRCRVVDEIAAVKRGLSIPVIGNGDIKTADDAIRMHRHTGCDAIMIARGSFGQPWIFSQVRAMLGRPRRTRAAADRGAFRDRAQARADGGGL
jgi:tRNA-dihydrouridine synthase